MARQLSSLGLDLERSNRLVVIRWQDPVTKSVVPKNKLDVSWLMSSSVLDTSVIHACVALPVAAISDVTPLLDCISTYLQHKTPTRSEVHHGVKNCQLHNGM